MRYALAFIFAAACGPTECPLPAPHPGPQQADLAAEWRATFPAPSASADACLATPVDWQLLPAPDLARACLPLTGAVACTWTGGECPHGAVREDLAEFPEVWRHEFAHHALWCDRTNPDALHKFVPAWVWVGDISVDP